MESIKKLILNPFSFFMIYLVSAILLYLMRLSNMYSYSIEYNIFLFLVIAFVIFLTFLFSKDFNILIYKDAIERSLNYDDKTKLFFVSKIILIVGIIGTLLMHLFLGGATVFQENKVNRLSIISNNVYAHYLGYFRVFLSYYIPLGYLIVKKSFIKKEKIFHIIGIVVAFLLLSLELNRGDFMFPCIAIIAIEVIPEVSKNNFSKAFLKFFIIIFVFLIIFKLYGNLRTNYVMKNIYKTETYDFYNLKIKNSYFAWTYIYLTSPLENFKYMLLEQEVKKHSYGMLLFYPFFQIFFKLSGNNLKVYSEQLINYLEKSKGLTVSSFMKDAYIDFGIIGIFIYLFIYYLFIYISLKNLIKRNNIYSVFAYSMMLNIIIWSVFVNSFAIGTFLIGYFLFSFLSLYFERIKYRSF